MACHHSITGLINKNSLFISYPQIKENSKNSKRFGVHAKPIPWTLAEAKRYIKS
jgi:hypothetical protein